MKKGKMNIGKNYYPLIINTAKRLINSILIIWVINLSNLPNISCLKLLKYAFFPIFCYSKLHFLQYQSFSVELAGCKSKILEQTMQHENKEASLLNQLHDSQQQQRDAVEMCNGG